MTTHLGFFKSQQRQTYDRSQALATLNEVIKAAVDKRHLQLPNLTHSIDNGASLRQRRPR